MLRLSGGGGMRAVASAHSSGVRGRWPTLGLFIRDANRQDQGTIQSLPASPKPRPDRFQTPSVRPHDVAVGALCGLPQT